MGNFSRDTFDQTKNYVAVRLQQGVPLVDADWNELEDVTRFELYEALRAAVANVASRGGLMLAPAGGGNDLTLSAGRAVIDGRPIRLWSPLQYSTQRYANAATAAADGVAPVTPIPLTQPAGTRVDVAYLDVFEREVTSAEDASLINGAIGIETAVRLKRELILRVAQGATTPPAAPAGHSFLPIALLNRTATALTAAQIQDVKPYSLPLGAREVSFAPVPVPATYAGAVFDPWTVDTIFPNRIVARKPPGPLSALGVIELKVPDGARITQIRLRGLLGSGGMVSSRFGRSPLDGSTSTLMASDTYLTPGAFDRVLSVSAAEPPVDNSSFNYNLWVYAFGPFGASADLFGGSIRFVP